MLPCVAFKTAVLPRLCCQVKWSSHITSTCCRRKVVIHFTFIVLLLRQQCYLYPGVDCARWNEGLLMLQRKVVSLVFIGFVLRCVALNPTQLLRPWCWCKGSEACRTQMLVGKVPVTVCLPGLCCVVLLLVSCRVNTSPQTHIAPWYNRLQLSRVIKSHDLALHNLTLLNLPLHNLTSFDLASPPRNSITLPYLTLTNLSVPYIT